MPSATVEAAVKGEDELGRIIFVDRPFLGPQLVEMNGSHATAELMHSSFSFSYDPDFPTVTFSGGTLEISQIELDVSHPFSLERDFRFSIVVSPVQFQFRSATFQYDVRPHGDVRIRNHIEAVRAAAAVAEVQTPFGSGQVNMWASADLDFVLLGRGVCGTAGELAISISLQIHSSEPTFVLDGVDPDAGEVLQFQSERFKFDLEADGQAELDTCVGQSDADGDGEPDETDNCTMVANAEQLDSDGDGFGNVCDGDFDQALPIVGLPDLTQMRMALGKVRASHTCPHDDGTLGSACTEFDVNGDGFPVIGLADLLAFREMIGKPPGPSGLVTP